MMTHRPARGGGAFLASVVVVAAIARASLPSALAVNDNPGPGIDNDLLPPLPASYANNCPTDRRGVRARPGGKLPARSVPAAIS